LGGVRMASIDLRRFQKAMRRVSPAPFACG